MSLAFVAFCVCLTIMFVGSVQAWLGALLAVVLITLPYWPGDLVIRYGDLRIMRIQFPRMGQYLGDLQW